MIKKKLDKPIGVAIDKITVLGNVKDLFEFEHVLQDVGFELQDYESKNFGYRKVYKHQIAGYIEVKDDRLYSEPDINRLRRRELELYRLIEQVQEGKATENMPSLGELNSSLEDVQALIKQCDGQGYLKKVERKDIRYEYNPKYELYRVDIGDIQHRILETLYNKHCTRVDVAIDYAYKLSTLMIVDKKKRKECIYLGVNKRLETVYIGARSSDMQLCVYDKKQENKDKGTIDQYPSEEHVARFEVRLKGAKALERFMNDEEMNPFSDLFILGYRTKLKEDLKYTERKVIQGILEDVRRGLNPFSEMTRRENEKYKKLLEETVKEKLDVKKDYKEKRRFLVGQLENVLKDSNQN